MVGRCFESVSVFDSHMVLSGRQQASKAILACGFWIRRPRRSNDWNLTKRTMMSVFQRMNHASLWLTDSSIAITYDSMHGHASADHGNFTFQSFGGRESKNLKSQTSSRIRQRVVYGCDRVDVCPLEMEKDSFLYPWCIGRTSCETSKPPVKYF